MKGIKRRGFVLFTAAVIAGALITGCNRKTEEKGSEASLESTRSSASSGAISVEIPPMSTEGKIYGIIIDASEETVTLQTDKGQTLKFEVSDDTDIKGLKDGIATGAAVRLEYDGEINGKNTKKVKVNGLYESEKLPKLSKDALAMAGEIILCLEKGDMSSLARLCKYPLIFERKGAKDEGRKIGNIQSFISLNKSDVFTKRLIKSVTETDLFLTGAYNDGFILGISESNIVAQNMTDGWKITGFHYK